jgi:hypothetical protein
MPANITEQPGTLQQQKNREKSSKTHRPATQKPERTVKDRQEKP